MNRIFLAGACALLLSGCGSTGTSIGNLIAFNSPKAPEPIDMAKLAAATPDKVDCPPIDVFEGGAAQRIGSGEGLRHQFSIADASRECTVANKQISIRVGVSGRVLAGPAGGAGSFTVPVRVGIKRDSDQKIIASKVYNVPATIPAGQLNTSFALVADPLIVPYTREEANLDYTVMIGLGAR